MSNVARVRIPAPWMYRIRCGYLDLCAQPVLAGTAAVFLCVAGRILSWTRVQWSIRLLSWAHLFTLKIWGRSRAIDWLRGRITPSLAKACTSDRVLSSGVFDGERPVIEALQRAGLVLKKPCVDGERVLEKGVYILKYTHQIESFRRSIDMEAFLDHYTLVLEPSWTGYSNLEFLAYTRYARHEIVMLSPFVGDREFLHELNLNLVPIELGPGDWVDPRVFRPLDDEAKRYDAVMIARWDDTKRHDLLLSALRNIADSRFRVALVAMNLKQDRHREGILQTIAKSGLGSQIEILEDLTPEEVNCVFNQSKVNVLLSSQEGGNRALFEGFFAGIPGLAFRNHIGVRTEHFRPETGRLIERSYLAQELLFFREHWREFNPRPWALANISPEISTQRLNAFLRERSVIRGERWTADLLMKCNRPSLCYYSPETLPVDFPTMPELLDEFRIAPSAVRTRRQAPVRV